MEVEHPYSTDTFNALPALGHAHDTFLAQNGPEVINALGALFVKYKLVNDFGVALLHRHFALEESQRLVEVNGTSTPWTVPEDANKSTSAGTGTTVQKYGGQIRPHLWMFAPATSTDGAKDTAQLTPSEFFFDRSCNESSNPKALDKLKPSFIQQFAAVLATHNLLGTLGLYLIRPESLSDTMRAEVTEGRANVTFPHDPAKTADKGLKFIEAQWQYAQDGEGADGRPIVRAQCKQVCVTSIFVPSGHDNGCV